MLNQKIDDATVEKHLNASKRLTEEMGVYQHHDAVAGTAKQLVADDYALRLSKGLNISTESYSDLMNEKVKAMSGYKLIKDKSYQMCDRTNGTFIDCPIVNFNTSEGNETFITIHNPSTVHMKMAQVSVPSGKFIA